MIFHNRGSRAAPAHELRITVWGMLERVIACMAKTFPGHR
jgi:hypothetical protein